MTPDERNILQPFLQELSQSRGADKDPEADRMIQQAIASNPDAIYLLVQHAILADQALHSAQAQIEQLQSGGPGPQPSSFLTQPPAPTYGGQGVYPPPAYVQSGYAQPAYGQAARPLQSNPFTANSGLGNFLRSAGTMAAGVAAGDFLANGLSNIFGGGRDW